MTHLYRRLPFGNDLDFKIETRQPCHANRRPVWVGFFWKRARLGFQPDRELGFRGSMESRHVDDIVKACARCYH